MLTEEEKQTLEHIIKANPEKGKIQQQLQRYVNELLNKIIATEEEDEGRT
ncbi:hypothetical protein LR013_00395 [candidate division NPL-UPA2 bacterium]|nr:hypothetical protein [candidate division NPL-UPA2 bacterium]